MIITKQYVVEALVKGCKKLTVGFLTAATSRKEALSKTQEYINENGRFAVVKNRCKIATEQDLEMFKDYPKAVLGPTTARK